MVSEAGSGYKQRLTSYLYLTIQSHSMVRLIVRMTVYQHSSDIAPGGYGGTPIEMRGFFQATIQYKARKPEERVYVSMHGATILGWPTQAKLKIILDPAQIQPVLQTTPSMVDRFEDVFDQSNNAPAKHFKHKIQWREEATPVQHKVRNIPLSVQPALSEEIQRLQNGGIIEPIEASKWVSPIVVARKPNGKIRMCVDLRDVNSKIDDAR